MKSSNRLVFEHQNHSYFQLLVWQHLPHCSLFLLSFSLMALAMCSRVWQACLILLHEHRQQFWLVAFPCREGPLPLPGSSTDGRQPDPLRAMLMGGGLRVWSSCHLGSTLLRVRGPSPPRSEHGASCAALKRRVNPRGLSTHVYGEFRSSLHSFRIWQWF